MCYHFESFIYPAVAYNIPHSQVNCVVCFHYIHLTCISARKKCKCKLSLGKAKKKKNNNNSVSQSLWQIGRPAGFFLTFFFFFFCLSSRHVKFELVTILLWNMELDFWMNKIQDRAQSWRSLLFKVFSCVCYVFSCIFDKYLTNKFVKNGKN